MHHLGSDWLLGSNSEDWLWRNAHKPGRLSGWQTGRVPGSVMHDLWQSGQIPDPYFEQNSLLAEWAPQRTWVYKKSFPIGEELLGKRICLVFEGVDYEARFFLNGEPLGEHRGMYTPAVFEVGDRLLYGQENLLVVVITRPHSSSPRWATPAGCAPINHA
jgi:beta-mannosidase